MSHHLNATFHLFLFIIFFNYSVTSNKQVNSFKSCSSLSDCNQAANFTCVIPRLQCECRFGFLPNNEGSACHEAQCTECVNIRNTECVGGKCKCSPPYISDLTSNSCVIPPDHTVLFIVIPTVAGVLIVAIIIGVLVWRYKRTQKQNSKTFHFQSGGRGGDDVGGATEHTVQTSTQILQTNHPNDHQMVFNTDASFSGLQLHQHQHQHQQQHQPQLPTGQQTVCSTPADFPPPYSVEDYSGQPSTSFANPNSAVFAGMYQSEPLQTPGSSNPYSPIASNKLTVL